MSFIKRRREWELRESEITPEPVYLNRRALLSGSAGMIVGGSLLGRAAAAAAQDTADPTAGLYPVPRNEAFELDRPLTDEEAATTYNNFYEFGSQKEIWREALQMPLRPWTVVIDGLVEEEKTVDMDTLIGAMPLEERLYRHRCVEAWSMAVPWSGFPMAALVDFARPLGDARYVRMETFDSDHYDAPGFRQFWYPWPYVEGLTMAEATNELTFLVTGIYGHPVGQQNGAPLRLATPWKYGFKSVKSIARFTFTDEQPLSFWEELQASEYGFWANVNPEVSHPRWSQATERVLGTNERVPTLIYNGYGEWVAHLYQDFSGRDLERLFM